MRKLRNEGFTLIEIVVVMAIIAVLAVLVVGAITIARNTARETQNRADTRTVHAWVEAYYSRNKVYPEWNGCLNDLPGSGLDGASTLTFSSTNVGPAGCAAGYFASSDTQTNYGDWFTGEDWGQKNFVVVPLNAAGDNYLTNDRILGP